MKSTVKWALGILVAIFLIYRLTNKEQPQSPQVSPAPPAPAVNLPAPLAVSLPAAPEPPSSKNISPEPSHPGPAFKWNLRLLEQNGPAALAQLINQCASSQPGPLTKQESDSFAYQKYFELQACESMAALSPAPCRALEELHNPNQSWQSCLENAFFYRIMWSLASGSADACTKSILSIPAYQSQSGAQEDCDALFKAHKTGDPSFIKTIRWSGPEGMEPKEKWFWVAGENGCSSLPAGGEFGAGACRKQLALSETIKENTPAACKKNALCAAAAAMEKNDPCRSLRLNFQRSRCIVDLQKAIVGNEKIGPKIFSDLSRLLQNEGGH